MSNSTIDVPIKNSNDVLEFLFVSSTEATTSTGATTTTEATTTTSEVTTTTTTTTTTTEEPTTEATTTTKEEPTTTDAPPLMIAELVMDFEETTTTTTTAAPPTTEVVVEVEETTTTAPPTTEVVVEVVEETTTTTAPPLVTTEVVENTEETIDWSTFADELQEKIRESVGSDEDLEPAAEGGEKVVEPMEEVSVSSTSKSYFSCSSPAIAEDGTVSPPGKAILLEYDYDLTTIADLDENTLSGLDDGITKNLADIYGLTACRRRHLRGLETDVVILALDSKPADVSAADTAECATQVTDTTSTFSCTPISGSMTAYVENDTDVEVAKAKLLSLIEDGMASGAYTDDNIIKTSYIGSRPIVVADDVVDDTTVPVMSEIEAAPLREEEPLTMAIGLSVFLLGFATLVLLMAFCVHRHKNKKDVEEPSNDDEESTQQPVKHDVEKVESAESTVDLTEKGTTDLSGDMYGNVVSNTLSSSGEEDDIQYAMTEDYSHLAHHTSNGPDITQVHPEACLAVIADSSFEARSFETGTPITTPITSPVSSPRKLLPCIMSPETSVEEDLLAGVDHGTTLDSIPMQGSIDNDERLDVDHGTTLDSIPI
eukprot:scaffold2632_cov136-Skeletonema_dohrnii-CCMP3373.AAC.4